VGATWQPFESWLPGSAPFDAVVHSAALRHRHGVAGDDYLRVNGELTQAVMARAERGGAHLVHLSSISVYGWPPPARLPIDESFPFAPLGPYGASKVATEELVMRGRVGWTIVQPSITYGPGDTNGMIDKMMRLIARHAFLVPGLGRTRVQLVYIDDLARLTVDAAVNRPRGERFICTYRDPIEVGDLVGRIARVVHGRIAPWGPPTALLRIAARALEALEGVGFFAGREPPLTREKLATISVDRAYRIDRLRAVLGAEPEVGYDDGLARTARAMGLA
ncbi:MAG: NAD(P)-dependent oxidoreductase, partial [Myxococcota bacterium]|nr:NAD(P)-dependent oxidoreductase [Myxococcota bacterium]